MKFTDLGLAGVCLIEPLQITDGRGTFYREFCSEEFVKHGLVGEMKQGNMSVNPHVGTLRGFHYQISPFLEAKTLSCATGSIYDIVVDLRRGSPTFMKWVAVDLRSARRLSLHVPAGCANAWITTEPDTIVHYYMSEPFAPQAYRGFRFDDPTFGFQWPMLPRVISDRDLAYPPFDSSMLP